MSEADMLNGLEDDSWLLDDLEDLPSFVTFPTGAFVVTTGAKGIERKIIESKTSGEKKIFYGVNLTLVSIEEVDRNSLEEDEELPKVGDIASILFDLKNSYGQGNMKLFAKPICERFHVSTGAEIMANSKELTMLVVVKRTKNKDKNGNDRLNMQLRNVALM